MGSAKTNGLAAKIFFGVMLLLFWCAIAGFGYKITNDYFQLEKDGVATTAEVVDFVKESRSRHNRARVSTWPVIEFYADKYNAKIQATISASHMVLGQKIEILYSKSNPDIVVVKARQNVVDGLLIPFSGLGVFAVFLAFMSYLFYRGCIISGQGKFKKIQNSTIVNADVVDVFQDEYDLDKWIIKAQWHDAKTNKIYIFESEGLDYNPKKYLSSTVNIELDLSNPKNYQFILNELPQIVT